MHMAVQCIPEWGPPFHPPSPGSKHPLLPNPPVCPDPSPQGGLRPHNYCLPILKRERHREAVAAAATSGSPKFFLGTDSAPHARHTKEAPCGCAGVYSAPIAMALYATAFEQVRLLCERPKPSFCCVRYGVGRHRHPTAQLACWVSGLKAGC